MSNNNNRDPKGVPLFHLIFSTGLGTGYVPVAPGTAGAFLALVIWYVLYLLISPAALLWATIGLILFTTVAGAWTSNVMERYWGEDPRTVVIDEFVGTWIPLLVANVINPWHTAILAIFGFAAFRLIDIFKPLGCRWVDRNIHGGWGVMLDDVLAGTYALILTLLLRQLFFQPLF